MNVLYQVTLVSYPSNPHLNPRDYGRRTEKRSTSPLIWTRFQTPTKYNSPLPSSITNMSRPAARLLGLAPKLTRPNSTTTTPSSLQRLLSAPPQNLLIPSSSTIPRSLNALHQPIPAAQSPQHVHINHPNRLFPQRGPAEWPQVVEQNSAQVKEKVLRGLTGLDVDELRGLTRYTVVLKRVVNMTKKGKM